MKTKLFSMVTTIITFFLVTGTSVPALAQEAESLLQEGIVNFRVAKFNKAIKMLNKAKKKAKDPKTLGQIHLYLGFNYAVLKNTTKANDAFTAALTNDPTVSIKSDEIKESVQKMFLDVRAGMIGSLEVTSDRAASAVFIDGKKMGDAPYKGTVQVGRHELKVVSNDGLSEFTGEVVVAVGQQHKVSAKLVFVGGRLNLTSRPAGARVLVDGKEVGLTPVNALVTAGEHEVRIEVVGYETITRKVKLASGGTTVLDVTLNLAKPEPAVEKKPEQPTGAQPTGVPETPRKRIWPIWTTVAGAAALAALGAGIGLGVASDSAFEEYQTTKDPKRYDELQDQVPILENASRAMYVTAGALAAAAVVLLVVVDKPWAGRAEAEPKSAIALRVTGNGLRLEF